MAAPPVTVPMNFGRHHIGSKTHSNMTLRLKSGGEMKVSSLILSFNSPVIQRLIAGLEITSLDVDDFEDSAVRCFVDCAYTGGIEFLDMKVFGDVNKMAHVFEVEWLVRLCHSFFSDCLSESERYEFDEVFNLVKESWHFFQILKKDSLWTLMLDAIHYLGLTGKIIKSFRCCASCDNRHAGFYR